MDRDEVSAVTQKFMEARQSLETATRRLQICQEACRISSSVLLLLRSRSDPGCIKAGIGIETFQVVPSQRDGAT